MISRGVIKEKFAVKKDDDSWKDLIRRRAFTVKNYGWKHRTKNLGLFFLGKRIIGIA